MIDWLPADGDQLINFSIVWPEVAEAVHCMVGLVQISSVQYPFGMSDRWITIKHSMTHYDTIKQKITGALKGISGGAKRVPEGLRGVSKGVFMGYQEISGSIQGLSWSFRGYQDQEGWLRGVSWAPGGSRGSQPQGRLRESQGPQCGSRGLRSALRDLRGFHGD